MVVGQFLLTIAVIHHHIVAWLVIAARCLCLDGSSQTDEMISWSLQREFSVVVISVGGVVTTVVIHLIVYRIRSQLIKLHNLHYLRIRILRRNLDVPYGIETDKSCGRCHDSVARIERTFSVRFCAPTRQIVIIPIHGERCQFKVRHIVFLIGEEYIC